ncbi:sel1 repeat family protein [Pseudoxanthomonas winnipegensis]|jgi:hypothetical protein|uniref:Sel1 repeat family protein n=1 Tax=Pseudoxanthomonas winnipegensis TaxID=2480810 RepID=A0A4Q8LDI4_9GAMM|nr:sel1 repeat family protein [Pseudoxanthomonas winnipegensis]TAA26791.1 sel1 repeat family protein [Pseudoxanthomonas winnipegensis]
MPLNRPTIMFRHTLSFGFLLALSIAGCERKGDVNSASSGSNKSDTGASAEGAASAHSASQAVRDEPAQAWKFNALPRTNPRDYVCDSRPECNEAGGVFSAKSAEEANWLISHGYPSLNEKRRLESLSVDQLKKEASDGSMAAQVEYAARLALQGNLDRGVALLRKSAQSGNLYSYYALSDVYDRSKENRDVVGSAAYLRLAYILGDYKAADVIAERNLSAVELAAADRRAFSLYETFSGLRRPSPRPL